MDIPGKGVKGLVDCLLLLLELHLCGIGVAGYRRGLDTFQTADRLERNGGIYWLCHADLGGGARGKHISSSLSVLHPFLYV